MNNKKSFLMILIIASINSGIYGVVYMRSSFYNIMQEALHLTHTQMGNLWTLYGVTAMAAYLFGGVLSDRISARRLVMTSMVGIIVSGLWLSMCPPYPVLCVLFISFGVFAILTYYPVSIKIIAALSEHTGSGKGFGSFWGLNGIVNVIVLACGIGIVKLFPDNPMLSFGLVTRAYVTVVALGLFLFIKVFEMPAKLESGSGSEAAGFKEILKGTIQAMRSKAVWIVAFVIFTNYLVISSFSYFNPFMKEVLGVPETRILIINLIRGDVLGIFAPMIAGTIADRIGSTARTIGMLSVSGAVLVSTLLVCMYTHAGALVTVLMIVLVYLNFIACKGIGMAVLGEAGISSGFNGSVIGLVSVIGYMPDAFYYSAAGGLIDRMGAPGYNIIWGLDIAAAVVTAVLCRKLYRIRKIERN